MSYLDNKGVERLWTHIIAKLGDKVNKEEGKGLSSNDFTAAEKTKLASLTAPSIINTGAGNAVTNISVSGSTFTVEKNADFLTEHPYITKYADTSSTASPAHGDTFTAVDSISRDENGHVEKINVKTITLPEYTLAGLMGSTAKGSATLPVYWTGSAWATITSYEGAAAKVANALSINGKTYDGSAAIDVGVIDAAHGGTGKTSLLDSANTLINALDNETSTPVDADYFISQYVAGGTTTTTYHRRPMSALYAYMKGKMDSVYQAKGTIPIASSTALGGVKVGSGLTIADDGTLNHSNSITAKTAYGSAATTASADGGTITLTDVQYDAQGHITDSTDRTITLSQRATTLEELGIDTFDKLNTKYGLDDKYKIAPDWNESNSTSKNYIKNRPGGYVKNATTGDLTITFKGVENTSDNPVEMAHMYYQYFDKSSTQVNPADMYLTSINAGMSYTVIWNGLARDIIAKEMSNNDGTGKIFTYLGEIDETGKRPSFTNCPFFIFVTNDKDGKIYAYTPSATSARSITFAIGGYNVTKIPEYFLQLDSLKTEMVNNLHNLTYDDLNKKPGAYTTESMTLYLPIDTASQSVISYFQFSYNSHARYYDLQADEYNNYYDITYNGTSYNLPAIPVYMNTDTANYTKEYDSVNCIGIYIALGNLSLLQGLESETTGNDCPIVILSQAMMERGAITVKCAEGSTLATGDNILSVSGFFVNRLVSLNVYDEVNYPNLMFDSFTFNYAIGTRTYTNLKFGNFQQEIVKALNSFDSSHVSKSGDTMTGTLNIEDASLYIKGVYYPSLNIVPIESTSKIKKAVFEGSYAGSASMSAWEDDSGQNRRIIEVRAKAYESSLDNALMLNVCDNNNWSYYKVFHSGTTVPITSGGTGATTAAGALTALGAFPISGGTLTGAAMAGADAQKTLSTSQLRNITISTTDLVEGESTLAEGEIYLVYDGGEA